MPFPFATPIVIVTAVIAAGVLGVAAVQFAPEKKTSKSTPLIEPTVVMPTSTPSSALSSPPMPASEAMSAVFGIHTSQPNQPESTQKPVTATPTPTPTPPPSQERPSGASSSTQSEPTLSFVNLPTTVRSGQSFTVAWEIRAPSPTVGTNTTLKVERHGNQQSGSSNSKSNSTSSQSYGSFTTPAQFDADFTFAGDPGDIQVEVTATISGKTITKQATINFET